MTDEEIAKSAARNTVRALITRAVVGLVIVVTAAVGAMAVVVASPSRSTPVPRVAVAPQAPEPPTVDWAKVGASVQGRPILMATFGSGKRRFLMVGGIHGSEFGSDVAEQFAAWLMANPDTIPTGTQVDIVACANPDGRALGQKGNAHDVNLNGNFPTRNWKRQDYLTTTAGLRPASEPETQVLVRLLKTGYTRVVSLHSQGGLVDYDGPGGLELASRLAAASGLPVKKFGPASDYAGSLGTYVPERFGIPVITIELTSREMTSAVLAGLVEAAR